MLSLDKEVELPKLIEWKKHSATNNKLLLLLLLLLLLKENKGRGL
jgi:hypothetical protein